MAKVKLYRYPETGTMTLQISNGAGQKARHSLPVTLTSAQWDGEKVTSAHKNRAEVQAYLSNILSEAQLALVDIKRTTATRFLSAQDLRDLIVARIFRDEERSKPASFIDVYKRYASTRSSARTRELYETTLKRIREHDARDLTFEQVDLRWLEDFNQELMKRSPSKNARAIHFRNIRAVFNYALKHDLTLLYPFRKFQIETEETIHRDLTVEDLRKIFSYQPPTVRPNPHATKPLDYAVKYVDFAKLSFFLIGINPKDLCLAAPGDYYGGRIHYRRAKTHKLLDVKVEPEAAALIEKYKGSERLLSMSEGYANYKDFVKRVNTALRKISADLGLPPVTMYWMRHTWATIAYDEGASMDQIADCLGQKHGSTITAIYVNKGRTFSSRDEINRAVIDAVCVLP